MESLRYLSMMAVGYLLTITLETSVLLVGLSRRHPYRRILFAGCWLTACTYPIVWLVLPPLLPERWLYLLVAETFAPVGECLLFYGTFGHTEPRSVRATWRDMIAITVANLVSFLGGELLAHFGMWDAVKWVFEQL